MKRIIALITSIALAACILGACGDDETYRRPGTGTTLGEPNVTTVSLGDDNGSYSADPDGEVSQTTDENILEDGMDSVESGIDQGMDDLREGVDDLEQGADEMLGGEGNETAEGTVGNDINGAGQGTGNGATNGNSH